MSCLAYFETQFGIFWLQEHGNTDSISIAQFARAGKTEKQVVEWPPPLRPIYTEELPGVAAHDSLFILLRRVILRSCTAWHGNSWAQ